MVLVGTEGVQRSGAYVLNLRWRSIRPLTEDIAVSTRLLNADGSLLGVHDTQPALGAFPTLKWVVRDTNVLDPHPFASLDGEPAQATVVVYERFRGTAIPISSGPHAAFPLR
jgi:hypothetical protein